MTNTVTPTKPADLDNSILHTPEAVRQWKQDSSDYYQAVQAIKQAEIHQAQLEYAHRNRTLTSEEYYQESVKRKAAADALAAERAEVEKAKALENIERLMGSPAIADILHHNEYSFMQEVIQWANRNYVMAENGFHSFGMGLYHIQMSAPVAPKKAGK